MSQLISLSFFYYFCQYMMSNNIRIREEGETACKKPTLLDRARWGQERCPPRRGQVACEIRMSQRILRDQDVPMATFNFSFNQNLYKQENNGRSSCRAYHGIRMGVFDIRLRFQFWLDVSMKHPATPCTTTKAVTMASRKNVAARPREEAVQTALLRCCTRDGRSGVAHGTTPRAIRALNDNCFERSVNTNLLSEIKTFYVFRVLWVYHFSGI